MSLFLGSFRNLSYLGFCHVSAVLPTRAETITVDGEHNEGGFRMRLMENLDENMNHKVHGGVIIVVNDDPVPRWYLGLHLFFYKGRVLVGRGIVWWPLIAHLDLRQKETSRRS